MKITKRIAEAQYCYTEVEFESLEEYKKEWRNFALEYREEWNTRIKDGTNKIGEKMPPLNK